VTGGWGGARMGAGRPRVRLIDLVRSRTFDARSKRHRRLLRDDRELRLFLAGGDERSRELLAVQAAYRRSEGEDSFFLANSFAELVKEIEC